MNKKITLINSFGFMLCRCASMVLFSFLFSTANSCFFNIAFQWIAAINTTITVLCTHTFSHAAEHIGSTWYCFTSQTFLSHSSFNYGKNPWRCETLWMSSKRKHTSCAHHSLHPHPFQSVWGTHVFHIHSVLTVPAKKEKRLLKFWHLRCDLPFLPSQYHTSFPYTITFFVMLQSLN